MRHASLAMLIAGLLSPWFVDACSQPAVENAFDTVAPIASDIVAVHSHTAPILHLSGFFTFDPDAVLRLSNTVKQLGSALRGDDTFAITTDATRKEMSAFTPPPRVPPP